MTKLDPTKLERFRELLGHAGAEKFRQIPLERESVPYLIELLKDKKDNLVSYCAAWILGDIGERMQIPEAVQPLKQAMYEGKDHSPIMASSALKRMGKCAEETIIPIIISQYHEMTHNAWDIFEGMKRPDSQLLTDLYLGKDEKLVELPRETVIQEMADIVRMAAANAPETLEKLIEQLLYRWVQLEQRGEWRLKDDEKPKAPEKYRKARDFYERLLVAAGNKRKALDYSGARIFYEKCAFFIFGYEPGRSRLNWKQDMEKALLKSPEELFTQLFESGGFWDCVAATGSMVEFNRTLAAKMAEDLGLTLEEVQRENNGHGGAIIAKTVKNGTPETRKKALETAKQHLSSMPQEVVIILIQPDLDKLSTNCDAKEINRILNVLEQVAEVLDARLVLRTARTLSSRLGNFIYQKDPNALAGIKKQLTRIYKKANAGTNRGKDRVAMGDGILSNGIPELPRNRIFRESARRVYA